MVLLRPLARALADGDRIYAVIRGAAVNQDGHTSSMTVPSVDGQAAMLRAAYAHAGVRPSRVAYVEAHGTGTPVGDPIEARALGQVLSDGRPAADVCPIGSLKTNIGHLEAASGIAGLIKGALVAHHGRIPASLNYQQPNPDIPFADLRLCVAARPCRSGRGIRSRPSSASTRSGSAARMRTWCSRPRRRRVPTERPPVSARRAHVCCQSPLAMPRPFASTCSATVGSCRTPRRRCPTCVPPPEHGRSTTAIAWC
jgi:hypothetical protein